MLCLSMAQLMAELGIVTSQGQESPSYMSKKLVSRAVQCIAVIETVHKIFRGQSDPALHRYSNIQGCMRQSLMRVTVYSF